MIRKILHDCDPGLDDAAALLMALGAADQLQVDAVTTVAGNVPLDATYRNARGLLALAGREDVSCHKGCPRALMVAPLTAEMVHGADGIGGVALPPPTVAASDIHSVDAIIAACRAAAPKGLTLVITGPMTNVAVALTMAPDIVDGVAEIVFMGGVVTGPGNITPVAEFNFAVDPHAAAMVLAQADRVPMVMMGLDVTRQVVLTDERLSRIGDIGSPPARSLAAMLTHYQDSGGDGLRVLHDPCTMAYLLQPDLFTLKTASVRVETARPDALGQSIADWHADGPVRIATGVDADGFYRLLTDCIARV